MGRQLFRSQQNKMIAGVCSGVGEYLCMDPNIIRLIWLILGIMGPGVIAYLIAWVIIPKQSRDFFTNPQNYTETEDEMNGFGSKADSKACDPEKGRLFMGIALIAMGGIFFLRQFFSWFDMKYFLPLILIVIGGLIIFKGRKDSF